MDGITTGRPRPVRSIMWARNRGRRPRAGPGSAAGRLAAAGSSRDAAAR